MLINKKIIPVLIAGFLITFLSYFLRRSQYVDFPPVNDTRDEYKYAFNGISLIKEGLPKSWSWFDDYKNFEIKEIRGSSYRIVEPYFDDPPLFGLIMGSYSILKGMDSFDKVDAGALRWPMLKLGSLNVLLLFVLVYLLEGLAVASIAGLIFATVPVFVLSSRLPLAENFLVTLSLVCLLLLFSFLKRNSKISLFFILLFSGASILIKQTGVYIPAAMFFLLVGFKKIKPAVGIVFSVLVFLLIYLAYGFYYDKTLFIHLLSIFSGREINFPVMVIHLFDVFRISEKTMSVDGWLIFGWVSVFIFSFLEKEKKKEKNYFIAIVASYLVVFAVMSGHLKGWYRFPFYPFLSWSMAVFLLKIFKEPKLLPFFGFLAISGFASIISGTGEAVWNSFQIKTYQLLLPAVLLPFFLFELTGKKKYKVICQSLIAVVFCLAIYFNYQTIMNFQDQFWY